MFYRETGCRGREEVGKLPRLTRVRKETDIESADPRVATTGTVPVVARPVLSNPPRGGGVQTANSPVQKLK